MSNTPANDKALADVRRLLAERASKQRELDAINLAIEVAAGIEHCDRPTKPRITPKDLRRIASRP